MENEKPDYKGGVTLIGVLIFGMLTGGFMVSIPPIDKISKDSNTFFALSDSDKNFIVNVALNAPAYSDWCLQSGGTYLIDSQAGYAPITKQQAGALMQQGIQPEQDVNGNYYASVDLISRSCVVIK